VIYDPEKERAEREEQDRKDREEITALTVELDRMLENPNTGITTLHRQAELLDCMLYAVMRGNLRRDKENGAIDRGNLEQALRIQKQCVDTLKAAGTISYMQIISTNTLTMPYHPPGRYDE
jgi:hypothetical protein